MEHMSKKKIIIFGSTQSKYIKEIFESENWMCDIFSSCARPLYRRYLNFKKLASVSAVYRVGGGDPNTTDMRVARLLHKRIIIHWIGTDVHTAIKRKPNRRLLKIYHKYIHLAGSELLRKELQTIGIESTVIPIVPSGIQFSPLPMPEFHEVLAYIPEGREDFYNLSLLKEIAKRFPNIIFHVVANSGKNDKSPLPNLLYEGTLDKADMQNLYARCSILFRYPQHDGLSMMLLEALGTGRTVIYKYKCPFVKTPVEDTLLGVEEIFREVLRTPPKLNQEAIDYVNSEFSMKKQIERYKSLGIL